MLKRSIFFHREPSVIWISPFALTESECRVAIRTNLRFLTNTSRMTRLLIVSQRTLFFNMPDRQFCRRRRLRNGQVPQCRGRDLQKNPYSREFVVFPGLRFISARNSGAQPGRTVMTGFPFHSEKYRVPPRGKTAERTPGAHPSEISVTAFFVASLMLSKRFPSISDGSAMKEPPQAMTEGHFR